MMKCIWRLQLQDFVQLFLVYSYMNFELELLSNTSTFKYLYAIKKPMYLIQDKSQKPVTAVAHYKIVDN